MDIISEDHLVFLETIRTLAETNPFTSERPQLESLLLGRPVPEEPLNPSNQIDRQKTAEEINAKLKECLSEVRARLKRAEPNFVLRDLYRTWVWFYTYHKHLPALDRHILECLETPEQDLTISQEAYSAFRNEILTFLTLPASPVSEDNLPVMSELETVDLFAFCFQWKKCCKDTALIPIGGNPISRSCLRNFRRTGARLKKS